MLRWLDGGFWRWIGRVKGRRRESVGEDKGKSSDREREGGKVSEREGGRGK